MIVRRPNYVLLAIITVTQFRRMSALVGVKDVCHLSWNVWLLIGVQIWNRASSVVQTRRLTAR